MDRQKKLLLFGAAWGSALLLTWFYYSNAVAPKQEKTLRMVVATHDMPVGTLLQKNDLKLVNYPEKDVPKKAVADLAHGGGHARHARGYAAAKERPQTGQLPGKRRS